MVHASRSIRGRRDMRTDHSGCQGVSLAAIVVLALLSLRANQSRQLMEMIGERSTISTLNGRVVLIVLVKKREAEAQ